MAEILLHGSMRLQIHEISKMINFLADTSFTNILIQHYIDVIMATMASQITILTVVYSTINSDGDQRKHQNSASLAFVWGIHRDRWIPRTKGQLRGKCFHLMTSSWFCCDNIAVANPVQERWRVTSERSVTMCLCKGKDILFSCIVLYLDIK